MTGKKPADDGVLAISQWVLHTLAKDPIIASAHGFVWPALFKLAV